MNLFTVFLLCGVWHGASWNFVLWGAVHGVFLTAERRLPVDRLPWPLGWLYTLIVANAAFVLFRAQDLSTAGEMLRAMATFSGGSSTLDASGWALLAGCLVAHLVQRRFPIQVIGASLPLYVFAAGYGVLLALVLPFATLSYTPFIYFQF